MNLLRPGEYDLTFTVDLGIQSGGQNPDAYVLLNVLGTGSAGNGSWTIISEGINSSDDQTNFRRYTWTGLFELTDVVKDASLYADNEFLVGSFTDFYLRYQMDSRHQSGLTLNVDNLTFSSVGIPEPASAVLLVLGGLVVARRRR